MNCKTVQAASQRLEASGQRVADARQPRPSTDCPFLIPHSSFLIKPQASYSGTAMCSRASPWFTTGM